MPPYLDSQRDAQSGWLSRERALLLVLMASTVLVLYLCYRLVLPFLPALTWALALAVVARPLHNAIAARVPYPDAAAGLAVAMVAAILLVPVLLVTRIAAREATDYMEVFQAEIANGQWRQSLERVPPLASALQWAEEEIDVRGEMQRVATALGAHLQSFVTGSMWLLMQILITLFTLFYLFRDRRQALRGLRSLVPLSDKESDEVFTWVDDTIHATIYGTVVVSLVQGALGGVMFWLLGLPAPVLWGLLMGLLAIVPYLGAFVVWAPAAASLALQGDWTRALVLVGWGVIVVGLIDNLLYPLLVGSRLRMHTLVVFFAILGGLGVFGASGLVLGPVVVALAYAIIDIWRRRTAGGRMAEDGVCK